MSASVIKKTWVGLIALLLLAGFAWVVAANGPWAPIKVTVERVQEEPLENRIFGIGTVEARYIYRLGPTASGRIRQVLVDVGDRVTAGQLVAQMESVDLQARIEAANLAVQRARSSINTAEASLKLAIGEHRRMTSLLEKKLVSQSIADAREQEAAIANSALEVASKEHQRLQAELKALQQQLANLDIRAPVDGLVTSRDAEPGSTLVAGQFLLTLADPASYWVKARIDQRQARGLTPGQAASIVLRSRPNQPLTGHLVRIEPMSDSITEERIVAVGFDPLPDGLSSGELAETTIVTAGKEKAVAVPNAALRQSNGATGVWKPNIDKRLHFVPVATGMQTLDGKVEILDGLQSGDEVVVYASQILNADSKIKVVGALAGAAQ